MESVTTIEKRLPLLIILTAVALIGYVVVLISVLYQPPHSDLSVAVSNNEDVGANELFVVEAASTSTYDILGLDE